MKYSLQTNEPFLVEGTVNNVEKSVNVLALSDGLTDLEEVTSAALNNLNRNKAGRLRMVEVGSNIGNTYELSPNILYSFVSLPGTIKLGPNTETFGDVTYVNEYQILYGPTANNASIVIKDSSNANVKWSGGSAPTLVQGHYYNISVVNGLAVWAEFY